MTCRVGPISWISIFGNFMFPEELEQPPRDLLFPIKLSFLSFANFRFVSNPFM